MYRLLQVGSEETETVCAALLRARAIIVCSRACLRRVLSPGALRWIPFVSLFEKNFLCPWPDLRIEGASRGLRRLIFFPIVRKKRTPALEQVVLF